MKNNVSSGPPALATTLVRLCAPPADRESILGDLQEEFRLVESRGDSDARRWYWSQALRSAGLLAGPRIAQAPKARPVGGAAAGGICAIAAASLLGLFLELSIASPTEADAITIALVVTACALVSSTCGGMASTLAAGRGSLGMLAFVGVVVVAPDLILAGSETAAWHPLFLVLALAAALTGLILGRRLALASLTRPAITGGSA